MDVWLGLVNGAYQIILINTCTLRKRWFGMSATLRLFWLAGKLQFSKPCQEGGSRTPPFVDLGLVHDVVFSKKGGQRMSRGILCWQTHNRFLHMRNHPQVIVHRIYCNIVIPMLQCRTISNFVNASKYMKLWELMIGTISPPPTSLKCRVTNTNL